MHVCSVPYFADRIPSAVEVTFTSYPSVTTHYFRLIVTWKVWCNSFYCAFVNQIPFSRIAKETLDSGHQANSEVSGFSRRRVKVRCEELGPESRVSATCCCGTFVTVSSCQASLRCTSKPLLNQLNPPRDGSQFVSVFTLPTPPWISSHPFVTLRCAADL